MMQYNLCGCAKKREREHLTPYAQTPDSSLFFLRYRKKNNKLQFVYLRSLMVVTDRCSESTHIKRGIALDSC